MVRAVSSFTNGPKILCTFAMNKLSSSSMFLSSTENDCCLRSMELSIKGNYFVWSPTTCSFHMLPGRPPSTPNTNNCLRRYFQFSSASLWYFVLQTACKHALALVRSAAQSDCFDAPLQSSLKVCSSNATCCLMASMMLCGGLTCCCQRKYDDRTVYYHKEYPSKIAKILIVFLVSEFFDDESRHDSDRHNHLASYE